MGPFPARNGKRFIVAFVDIYSRFLIDCPIKDHNALTIVEVLATEVFANFGLPVTLLSDNALELSRQVWEQFAKICGLKIAHSSPYWP